MGLEGQLLGGRYRLLRPIGKGMSEVYLAEDARINNRQVAVKVTQSEAISSPDASTTRDATMLFQREVRAIGTLNHPNILPLFDSGEDVVNGSHFTYLVMPFCSEGSLATWLRQRSSSMTLPPQDVAYLVRQAADALQYTHDLQIVHRDVKPQNFLIRSNPGNPNRPNLLLADFGIAKFVAPTVMASQTVRGTPHFMAPEQWSGHPVPATDQYALAAMAYELLTGRPIFQASMEQMLFLHLTAQPQPPSSINLRLPKALDAVLLRALAKHPQDRYPSISAFAQAFEQAALNEPVAPPPAPPPPQPGRDIRATLPISNIEAMRGTSRVFTLPGGRQLNVLVPAGAYDGQVLRLEGQGEPSPYGGLAGALLLTVTVTLTGAIPAGTMPTGGQASGPNIQSWQQTSATPVFQGGRQISNPGLSPTFTPPQPGQLQEPPPQSRPGRGRIILLIVLAFLVVIVGGIGLFSFHQISTNNANATATAGVVNATATTEASHATATAAVVTATAQVNATATAVTTTSQNPYPPFGGTLALDDSLNGQSNNYDWQTGTDSFGASCTFKDGAYHAIIPKQGYFHFCIPGTLTFSNFAYQVQMTLLQGDESGIIFRANYTNNAYSYYYFHISQKGFYTLEFKDTANNFTKLSSGFSPFIKAGLNQTNLIAVVAQRNTITLYVNRQKIGSVSDNRASQGEIAVVADDRENSTEVAFRYAKVWVL
jgi:serine/threonine protein kinase